MARGRISKRAVDALTCPAGKDREILWDDALAGFGVAGLALLKVVFVDLSELDALYRVGSAFILGVVSLGIAYAYHRAAPRESAGP
jgi:uncharacterized membrane protein